MTSATTPGTSVTRRPQVFVEIPPSPFHTISTTPSRPFVLVPTPSSKQKENAFAAADDDMAESALRTSPRKRKLSTISSTNNAAPQMSGTSQPTPKKPKVTTASASGAGTKAKKPAVAKTALKPQQSNANEEFPDGFFYCHQCNKKRDNNIVMQCTYYAGDNARHARCRAKYCKICLKNRYGDDFDEIKARGENSRPKGHVKGSGYIFQCYRCRDICNCRNCRKAKGLEPTGNLTLAAKRSGAESAAAILGENPSAQGVLPGKGHQVEPQKKPAKPKAPKDRKDNAETSASAVSKSKADTSTAAAPKPKPKPAPKLRPVPVPKWTAVETTLDLHQAEDRFFIREFVLRFAGLLDIGKGNLEELDDIDADYVRGTGHEEEPCAWVSEPCAKAMIIGLLDVIAEEAESNTKKAIRDAVKEIRNSGANLTKIWAALAVLRDSVTSGPHYRDVDFPDALPPPSSAVFRSTRSGLGTGNEIQIAMSWQLTPVVVSLIEAVVYTKAVKEELDRGVERVKEMHKECREEVKKENERWESGKKGEGAKAKEQRAAHKQRIMDLEQALEVASSAYLPRSGPLGKDADGRVYWVLPVGAGEREFGSALLADASKAKVTKRGMVSLDDRTAMRRWSWFVAVWGRRPSGAAQSKKAGKEKVDEEEDDGEEKWWGFWDAKDIKTLADWLAVKAGVETGQISFSVTAKEEKASSRDTSIGKGMSPSAGTSVSAEVEMVDRSSSVSTPLSELSDGGEDELSELSDDEEEGDERDVFAEGPPSKGSVKNLVRGLREYAEVLVWRAGKWQKPVEEEKEGKGKRL
ncbi:hypothetical protein OE88DRAFT_1676860 [Heliocybe sulcata]|uniref:Zinc-finger domain-containing protein n=1 Tax=Heliocybe sulcata TaxID=5364 RepID=A0A5C3N8P0_9AGAM|nr:hypothetical protein OE88DRAFT_1676860 [Heliocybe sulcata]